MYLIESICKDKNGQEVKALNYVTIYNPSKNELPTSKPFWTLSIQSTCEPGDTAKMIIASSYKDVYLLNSIESDEIDEFQLLKKTEEA
jgi:uncharacterized protein YfaS (alpha-2-macroglobulin family)